MVLSVNDLKNGAIYLDRKGTLAERIDFAWSVYSTEDKFEREEKDAALKFLIFAFDITDTNEINEQLIQLMAKREQYKAKNPEYIPGKSPTLPFDPGVVIPQKTAAHGQADVKEIKEAIESKELLDVNNRSKHLDSHKQTKFLTPEERAEKRVHIRNGKFKRHGRDVDTSNMISHGKRGFAAFTLNANGELSIFNHHGMADRVAHSSMNAGAPVVAAGEIEIKRGVLKTITTHSGHYHPSLFNVYRFLEHLSRNNVDISQAKVVTRTDPSTSLHHLQSKPVYFSAYPKALYETPATQIYEGMNKIINENIDSINQQLKSYQKAGIKTSLFKLKDKLSGSDLTERRAELAATFEANINSFKAGLVNTLSAGELKEKINELNTLISNYQSKNEELSSGGRLAKTMDMFKERVNDLKSAQDEIEQKSTSMKKIS
ncbi:hypothetical protein OQJ05_10150 [Fluoribacter gormanii]|uniref:hypothetical protein n=1 Tax=Fluoribacter gormanii TaxID=464 RepID=UPI002244C702|nr:hypothetical protein [Fluoribacter gormanii]MCW8444411.1 hypothetical protein [Fluoribacter gormanii]